MIEYVHERMNYVSVENNDNKYEFNCIGSFEEYDNEVVIESAVNIDGLIRGFVGDLFYHTKGYALQDQSKEVTTVTCFKEALLAKISVSAQPGHAVTWRYTFLKC